MTLHDAQAEAERVWAILSPLDELSGAIAAGHEPGSPAASDRKRPVGRPVGDLARLKAESAADHLRAWRQIIAAGKLPLFAHYSLLRTALETSSTIRWLVDPKANQTERIARGLGAQRHDLEERRKFEDAAKRGAAGTKLPKGDGQPARVRLDELAKLADTARIKPVYRGSVECCRDYGREPEDPETSGEVIYRVLSSMAHGTQWAVLPVSERREVILGDHPGSYEALIVANPTYMIGMTAYVMRIFALAINELQRYGRGAG